MHSGDPGRPPRLWSFLSRLLIRGEQASEIREDLDGSYERDLERGVHRPAARRRYRANVLGSISSLLWARLEGLVSRGIFVDAKLGARLLARQPLLTSVAMLALGLGIPASLGVNHLFDVMFHPLPVPEGDRIAGVRYWDRERGAPVPGSVHDYAYWSEALASFQSLGAARSFAVNVHAGALGAPPVEGAEVTASTFDLLRAQPLLGRLFSAGDEVPGAPDVILISERLWSSRFTADPGIVGRTLQVGRRPHTVVGVLPAGFEFPDDSDVWLPLRAVPAGYPVGQGPPLWIYGRLADGIDLEDAQAEIELVTARAAADDPARLERSAGEVVEMPVLLLGDSAAGNLPALLVLQSMMLVLLLVVCGNVGTLMLARSASRSAEISIRTALGASRARIVTQLFVEALVLSLVATSLGLLGMEVLARLVVRTLEPYGLLPYWVDPTLTQRIVFLALGLAVVSAAVVGVIPGFKATGRGIRANIQRSAEGGATIRFGKGSTLLIVTQVVLSVGFLAMGSAMLRSVFQDTEGTLGFDPERYASAWFHLPSPEADGDAGANAAFDARLREAQQEVLERLRELEGVNGAALALHPPANEGPFRTLVLETEAGDEARLPRRVYEARVGVGYFSDLARPILAGRDFVPADLEASSGPRAVIVNTGFVEEALGGRSAVGVRFRRAGDENAGADDRAWLEIVGVVGPFGMNTLNPTRDAGYYLPIAPGAVNPGRYLVDVADPEAFLPRFRQIVADVDPEATAEAGVLADLMRTESRVLRGLFSLIVLLAAVAFLLSVAGLYALMSLTVSQRTREIGIRTALGARPSDIVGTVARRAALQLGLGLVLGAGWGWLLLGQFLQQEIAVATSRPWTLAGTLGCAALVGVAACLQPTLRGLRIQPTEALREL